MEEDDEFGDLYTDVLTSFTSASSLPVQNSVSINNDRKESTNLSVGVSDSHRELNRIELDEPKLPARVLEINRKVNLEDDRKLGFEDPNLIDESQINVIEDDMNGDDGIGDPVIPGLVISGGLESGVHGNGGGGDDDWDSDSDSDDGLQIVLNDYNAGKMGDGEDVDEDGNVLVVVDEDAIKQQMEDQDWGGDVELAQGGVLKGKNLGMAR